jgi:hypothetical protein
MVENIPSLQPLPGFQALDGCHCVTASFRKICEYNHYPISEEMLLALGAGVGFIYWHTKGQIPFLGGRGNNNGFNLDLSRRTGIVVEEHATKSSTRAEQAMIDLLDSSQPVVIYADMPYLTYLDLPEDAHFGGHAIVIAGYDGVSRQVLVADLAPRETGYKKGILNPLSMKQLSVARGSTFKPFPPGNHWFTFDFSKAHPILTQDIWDSIGQSAKAMLNPPIRNIGVEGIKTASKRAAEWPGSFDVDQLRMALFNVYIYTEIGGTGGGLFRLMYSRFLSQAADLTGDARLKDAAEDFQQIGEKWTKLVTPLKEALEDPNPAGLVLPLVKGLNVIAGLESNAWKKLAGLKP